MRWFRVCEDCFSASGDTHGRVATRHRATLQGNDRSARRRAVAKLARPSYLRKTPQKLTPMKISILDDYLDSLRSLACYRSLRGHDVTIHTDHCDDEDVLVERLACAEALILIRERTPLRASLLRRLPQLRIISLRSAYPHIDLDACTQLGIVVCSNLHPGVPSYATAELTWALILSAVRKIPEQIHALKQGLWQTALGTTLRRKTLGIYGFGRIGAAVADIGRAFGMRVCVYARPQSQSTAKASGFDVAPSREQFFENCDVVSVHVRLVEATRHSIGESELSRMKPSALFVNTSRADLIAPGALVNALRAGRPGGAAIDVFNHEP
ncbi:MAG TPA: D-2-hydroxyacid dehydrogenase family protein, partial [Rudaea sp.]